MTIVEMQIVNVYTIKPGNLVYLSYFLGQIMFN